MKRHFAPTWAILAGMLAFGTAFGLFQSRPAQAAELTIGMSQYPPNFHPNIEAVLAKTYILGTTLRPFTIHNHDWEGICLLCSELPTIENGLAVPEDTPEGGKGIALTYKIHPKATWGDGTPVTSADALLTWQIGRHPQSGISNSELYRRILALEVIDDKPFVLHGDRITFDYNLIHDFQLVPSHLERPVFEADPSQYRQRTTFDSDPTNPGLAFGPAGFPILLPVVDLVQEFPAEPDSMVPSVVRWSIPRQNAAVERTDGMEIGRIQGRSVVELPNHVLALHEGDRRVRSPPTPRGRGGGVPRRRHRVGCRAWRCRAWLRFQIVGRSSPVSTRRCPATHGA